MNALRERIVRSLEPFAGVRVAWLFGSQLTGRIGPESDLDIAVAYESTRERALLMERIAAPDGLRRSLRLDARLIVRDSCARPQ